MRAIGMKFLFVIPACFVALNAFAEKDSEAKAEKEPKAERESKSEREAKAEKRADGKSAGKKGISEISDLLESLDYPELQVVPRASVRLKIEAKEEERSWMFTHWPMEFAGLTTLGIGLMGSGQQRETLSATQKDDATQVSMVTSAVGGGWLLAGIVIGMQRPYRAGVNLISRYGENDERSVLLRERLSEEALEKPAKLMSRLKWAAVLSNFSLNVLMATYMTDQGRIMAGVSAFFAFLPVIFEDHTIEVYEKHLEYKKKIYGPLTSGGFSFDPRHHAYIPTANLIWMF